MNTSLNQRFHFGVYGILVSDNKMLFIKKSRGAYKGKYDLPGGGVEFNEKIEDALRREFMEETGIVLKDIEFIGSSEYFCDYLNDLGEVRKLHHVGLYYKVFGDCRKIKEEPDGQDSLGAEFIDIDKIKDVNISPISLPIIKKIYE
ncbi:MAG TPA: NUDIX domain-containing protein [bacterium]|nr:NUDIX domain-containing protein [bacterium]